MPADAFAQQELQHLMAMSYAQPAQMTTFNNLGLNTLTTAGLQDWAQAKSAASYPAPRTVTSVTTSPPAPERTKTPMARLIRYTVTDPDHVLADKKPEACILMGGTVMLNGADDKGFLMDLAPQVARKLDAHNAERAGVEYEDEEGRTKTLKPVKLSQLDVVVEVLKSY